MGRYFEEFNTGDVIESPSRVVTAEDIDTFVRLTGTTTGFTPTTRLLSRRGSLAGSRTGHSCCQSRPVWLGKRNPGGHDPRVPGHHRLEVHLASPSG